LEIHERDVRFYVAPNGRSPFEDWIDELRDNRAIEIIERRLARIRMGNFGDCESVGNGVFELRIRYGQGYRVYFAEDGDTLIILLFGGVKSSQDRDIRKAHEYWEDYRRRK